MIFLLFLFPFGFFLPFASSSHLEVATSSVTMPVFKVCSLLRVSPAGGHHHSLEIPSSLPWQWLLSCTVPSAQRAGEMLHPKLRSMSLHGKVGRVLCSSGVLPAPSFSGPCASCTFFFIFLFFFNTERKNNPFFLGMGDLKRETICPCSVFISQSLYICDTHIYIYTFILFFFCCLEFHPDYMCYSAVLDNISFAYTCFVVMQNCCSFIPKFRLLVQMSDFLPSGGSSSHLGILHT